MVNKSILIILSTILTTTLLAATAIPVYAADASVTWSEVDGPLPVASVSTVVSAGDTLYAGTDNGVWAWDGSSWSQVGGSEGLQGVAANITSLAVAGGTLYAASALGHDVWAWNGTLWYQVGGSAGAPWGTTSVESLTGVGSKVYALIPYRGVWAWDGYSWSSVGFPGLAGGITDNWSLADAGGTLYAASRPGVALYPSSQGNGLWAWNGSSWSQVGLPDNTTVIWQVAAVGGTLYAMTDNGLWAYENFTWYEVGSSAGLPSNIGVVGGTGGTVYAGTDNGVWAWDGSTWSHMGSSSFPMYINSLALVGGTLYAGTGYSGVWAWDGSSWSQVGGSGSPISVSSLALDGGTLYAGTEYTGVWAWDGSTWFLVGGTKGLTGDAAEVTSLVVVAGKLYALTGVGVWAWDGTTWSQVGGAENLTGVTSLVAAGGTLYAGTDNGVWAWDGSVWSQVGGAKGLTLNAASIRCLAVAGGTLYAGTGDGVWAWNDTSWSHLGTGDFTEGGPVKGVVEMDGTVYAIVYGGGVWAWDGSTWSQVGPQDTRMLIESLAVSGGTLYAGTFDSGVWAWDRSAWSQVGGAAALSGDAANIQSLSVAGGTLYAGGSGGVFSLPTQPVPIRSASISVNASPVNFYIAGRLATPPGGQFVNQGTVNVPDAFTYDETTYVPIRLAAQLLGRPLDWNSAAYGVNITTAPPPSSVPLSKVSLSAPVQPKTVRISVDIAPVHFYVDQMDKTPPNGVFRNQGTVSVPDAIIFDKTTYVPIRFAAELLGQTVSWDPSLFAVMIGSPPLAKQ